MSYIKHDWKDEAAIAKYTVLNNNKKEGDTREKAIINMKVANKIVDLMGLLTYINILFIEGWSVRTTKTIKDTGIPAMCCTPINDNKEICDKFMEHVPSGVYGSFNSAIDGLTTHIASLTKFVWYDGNKTVIGDEHCQPIEDVEKLLRKMNTDFTFAITFTSRSAHIIDEYIAKKLVGIYTDKEDLAEHIAYTLYRKKTKSRNHPYKINRGMNREQQIQILEHTFKNHNFKYAEESRVLEQYTPTMTFFMVDLVKIV